MSNTACLEAVAVSIASARGYEMLGFCGKGAFKETYRIRTPAGEERAMKVVDRKKISTARTARETSALSRCRSPRIASFFSHSTFSYAGTEYDLVEEEYINGGSLEDARAVRPFAERDVLELAWGLAQAVSDLHPLRLVHRDIKPANIMFRASDPAPVLVDFGIVRDLSLVSLTGSWSPQGPCTPLYASPEQLNNDKALIDWRSDQFSIAVVTWLTLTNSHPYQEAGMDEDTAVARVQERKGPPLEFTRRCQEAGLGFLSKMLSPWPVHRYASPASLLDSLRTTKR